jgi:hypothetical protein
MKRLLLIMLFGLSLGVEAQLSYPYRVFSENKDYFIKSIPFSDQIWTEYGKTSIFQKNDSTKPILTVSRYFQPDLLFLSNNGNSFCFVMNWFDTGTEWENDVIFFYKDAKLIKKYKGSDFVDTTLTKISSLCYNNELIDSLIESKGMLVKAGFKSGTDTLSKYFNTHNSFTKNDTLYLLTHNKFVNRFNLKTGELIDKTSFVNYSKSQLVYPKERIIQNYDIETPIQYGLPKLASGEEYSYALAKSLKMINCEGENTDCDDKYKIYDCEINCIIDSTGTCIDLKLDCSEQKIKKGVKRFFKSAKFNKSEIPHGIEKWYFMDNISLRDLSKETAENQRKLEKVEEIAQRQKQIVADSIDGIYIPIDIEDCFKQLDKQLKTTTINEFKSMSEKDATTFSHFGLGLWMRNNWGLWKGSRLSTYFNKLGITHPDDMSDIILKSYYRFLNKQSIDLNKQIEEH